MSAIKAAIKTFDTADEKYDEQLEAVRALEALGSAKAEIFVRTFKPACLPQEKKEVTKLCL